MRKITIRDDSRRAHFGSILEEWCSVIERYTNDYCQDDALYWYNERATLSTLAVAAGRRDFHVLEEYSAEKKGQEGEDKYTGRVDLYLAYGRTEYIFEAKQEWLTISDKAKDPIGKIYSSLKSARKDAAASNVNGVPVYGVVFAVPYLRKSFVDRHEEYIGEFVRKLSKLEYDAMAYVFPENAKTVNKHGTFYPGVACIIRAPRRKS